MNIADQANKLRVDLVRLGTGQHRRRYPPDMKDSILKFIEHARAAGVSVEDLLRGKSGDIQLTLKMLESQESLRLEISQRHAGSNDALHDLRDLQAARYRPDRVPRRRARRGEALLPWQFAARE